MSSTKELVFPGASNFQARAMSIVEMAKGIEILDDEGLEEVGAFLKKIKADSKELDRLCDPAIEAAFKEHRARVGFKKEYAAPLDEAEKIAKDKIAAYDRKRRAEIAAEQKRLEDIARKEAEERRRVEMERIEAENKIRREKEAAEQKIRDAEIARLKKEGDAKAAKKLAEEQEAAAFKAKAQASLDALKAKEMAAAPLKVEAVAKIEAPKAAGVSVSKVWAGEIIGGPNPGDVDPMEKEKNLRLLVAAITANKAPLYLVQEAATEVRKMAESTQGAVQVPGIRFYQKDRVSSR